MLGGPFNSGILATGARPRDGQAPYFDYAPAPPEVVAHVAAIEAVCARHGVPLRAAALQFPAAHPAVAVVVAGARSEAELDDLVAMRRFPIPAGFWVELRERGLVAAGAPLPVTTPQRMTGFVDAHHHVWSLARGDYAWLTPALAPIHRDFSLLDLAPLREQANVTTTVLVQAAPTVAETRYLLDVAKRSDGVVKGVVGWVDLGEADAIPTLTHLARNPLLKGVRPMLQDLPDAAWILRAEVGRALAALPRLGLRFDALVKPAQLPALLTMLDRHPDLAGRRRSWREARHRERHVGAVGAPDARRGRQSARALQAVGPRHRGRNRLDDRSLAPLLRPSRRDLRPAAV